MNKIPLNPNGDKSPMVKVSEYFDKQYTGKLGQNVGIMVGASNNNLCVIDIDDIPLAKQIRTDMGDATYMVRSGKGGLHIYMYLESIQGLNTTKLFIDDEDIGDFKVKGGYVVGAGSVHLNGNTYTALNNTEIKKSNISAIQKLLSKYNIVIGRKTELTYDEILNDVCPDGEGNDRLYKAAIYYWNTTETEDMAWQEVQDWNNRCCPDEPIDSIQLRATFMSAKGAKLPKGAIKKAKKEDNWIKAANTLIEKYCIVTFSDNNNMTYFNGKSYEYGDNTNMIDSFIQNYDDKFKNQDIVEIRSRIQRKTIMQRDEFKNNDIIVICDDKVINLSDYTLHEHDPMYYQLGHIPYKIGELTPLSSTYDIHTMMEILSGTLVGTFVSDISKDKGILIDKTYMRLIEAAALCILRKPSVFGKSYMLTGARDNGKSIYLSMLINLLGRKNVSAEPLQSLSMNRFSTANTVGKWANIVADISNASINDTAMLKNLATGDMVNAEQKGKPAFTFLPTATILSSANQIPPIKATDSAFFKRMVIIDLKTTFTVGINADTHLERKIQLDELGNTQLLRLLLFTGANLMKIGHVSHLESAQEVMNDWKKRSDPITTFIDEFTEPSDMSVSTIEVYAVYKKQSIKKGVNPYSFRYFKEVMKEHVDIIYNSDKRALFSNMQLRKIEPQRNQTID